MTSPSVWKTFFSVFLLCATTAIASPAQVFRTLFDFDGPNGANPPAESLVQGTDGKLYGTTSEGGSSSQSCPGGCGTVFEVTIKGRLKTLYTFCVQANCADGAQPAAGLALGTNGLFYGTTSSGGGGGTVFKITPEGVLTVVYSFCAQPNCDDGYGPEGLVQAADGNFYGTTAEDGVNGNYGTLFKISPSGKLTTLYNFCARLNCSDGATPSGGVVQGSDGNFYGTTSSGGDQNCNVDYGGCGTVFKITPEGKLTTLHIFKGTDGASPGGSLVQAADGNFYGTTFGFLACNVSSECGTVFKITPSGRLTTLYRFCTQANCTDGTHPIAGLIQATDGNFYGTTFAGGGGDCVADFGAGCGTVFELTPLGALTTLHSFDSADGANPDGGLLQATNGSFYGTTYSGGNLSCEAPYGCGTVFSLDVGLGPFVTFVRAAGKVGQTGPILGQGLTGTTSVLLNGTPASFTVVSDTYIRATVPVGATTGYVTVTTPSGMLTSNLPFHVIP